MPKFLPCLGKFELAKESLLTEHVLSEVHAPLLLHLLCDHCLTVNLILGAQPVQLLPDRHPREHLLLPLLSPLRLFLAPPLTPHHLPEIHHIRVHLPSINFPLDLRDVQLPALPLSPEYLLDHLVVSPPVAPLPVDALLHLVEIVPPEHLRPQEDLMREAPPLGGGRGGRPVLGLLGTLRGGVAATPTASTAAFDEGGDHHVEFQVLEVLHPLIFFALGVILDSMGRMVNVGVF